MTREWFSCIKEKIQPQAGLLRLENLSWPNHALYIKFHKTKACPTLGSTLNNIFIPQFFGFLGPVVTLQPLIEATQTVQCKPCNSEQTL
jgi:hypothetical protein